MGGDRPRLRSTKGREESACLGFEHREGLAAEFFPFLRTIDFPGDFLDQLSRVPAGTGCRFDQDLGEGPEVFGEEASQSLDQGARSAARLGGERGLGEGDAQECSRGIARQRAKIQRLAAPGLGMGGKLRTGCAVAGVGQLFESSVRDA